jgi:ribonuclease P protein component
MLAKAFRFHGHQAVRNAYRSGQSVRNELGSLHVHKNEKHPRVRVAVVVSKKVDKSSVTRNRIRRRIYEVIRLHPSHASFNQEMVFTVYDTEAATKDAETLKRDIYDLLTKAKVV